MRTLLLRLAGATEPVEVRLGARDATSGALGLAEIGDAEREFEAIETHPGGGFLRLGGRVVRYQATRRGDSLLLWIDGEQHSVEIVPRTARRAGAGAGGSGPGGDVTAPMPGTVLKILVSEGDAFEAHQPLVIMESMKMEMTLSSPAQGKVRKVGCTVGELVDLGATLIAVEAATSAGQADG